MKKIVEQRISAIVMGAVIAGALLFGALYLINSGSGGGGILAPMQMDQFAN